MKSFFSYKLSVTFFSLICFLICIPGLSAFASNYGSGTYGSCQYGSCGISISSDNSLNLNITPTSSGNCSIGSDTVSVLTDDSNGYTLTIATSTSNNSLVNGASSITSTTGNQASPSYLSINTWGYRVDGIGGFGTGPTITQSNISFPNGTLFATIPSSSGSPDTIATDSSAADPAVNTSVWYGVCADTNITAGNYTAQITYSAIAN